MFHWSLRQKGGGGSRERKGRIFKAEGGGGARHRVLKGPDAFHYNGDTGIWVRDDGGGEDGALVSQAGEMGHNPVYKSSCFLL